MSTEMSTQMSLFRRLFGYLIPICLPECMIIHPHEDDLLTWSAADDEALLSSQNVMPLVVQVDLVGGLLIELVEDRVCLPVVQDALLKSRIERVEIGRFEFWLACGWVESDWWVSD